MIVKSIVTTFFRKDLVGILGLCALDMILFSNFPEKSLSSSAALNAYAAVGYLVLLRRKHNPVPVFAFMLAHSVAAGLWWNYRPTLGVLLALYSLTAKRGRRDGLLATALMPIVGVRTVLYSINDIDPNVQFETAIVVSLFLLMVFIGVWKIGDWAHKNQRQVRQLELQREQAVVQERALIARELHDIVAHSVTLMIMKTAGAELLLQQKPEQARSALEDVHRHGKQAMNELRRMLNLLNTGTDGTVIDENNEIEIRLPGIDALACLCDDMCSAGLIVSLQQDGIPRQLDPSVDLAAYRVAQEALTNVGKHVGRGAKVEVQLFWSDEHLELLIIDNGIGKLDKNIKSLSTNHGLAGLHARVKIAGGSLETEAISGGGFRVWAALPVLITEVNLSKMADSSTTLRYQLEQ